MSENTPEPCPWCGDTPVVVPLNAEKEGDAWAGVECRNPDCEVRPKFEVRESHPELNFPGSSQGCKDGAIRLWNRRALAPLPAAHKGATSLRMDAYYYSFALTGNRSIDLILSAVACAGKAFHHTESWTDEAGAYPGHRGETPAEWIQNAANDAAVNAYDPERVEALVEALRKIADYSPGSTIQPCLIARAALAAMEPKP